MCAPFCAVVSRLPPLAPSGGGQGADSAAPTIEAASAWPARPSDALSGDLGRLAPATQMPLCSAVVSRRKELPVATLAFNHEEIVARELKPALLELDGI